jgi:cytosine/adenosine deaminase-related metal-dependent hydrolase
MSAFSKITLSLSLALLAWSSVAADKSYDVVISSGRVIDPESGYDQIANVGIRGGKIAAIAESELYGSEIIDAAGYVVAPGFIDTHWHALDVIGTKLGLRNGVTTQMDLEVGSLAIDEWYDQREGKSLANFGTTASQVAARMLVLDSEVDNHPSVSLEGPLTLIDIAELMEFAARDGLPAWSIKQSDRVEHNQIMALLDNALREGAIGVGVTLGYMRHGVTTFEQLEAQRVAANYGRVAAVHARFYPGGQPPNEHPLGFDEVFANAVSLNAPLLYQHNADYGWFEIEEKLGRARAIGFNMWSEIYPYSVGSTVLGAEYLLPEVYESTGNTYGQSWDDGGIYDPQTDSFYSKKDFLEARKREPGKAIFVSYNYRQNWYEDWLQTDHMTIASDSAPSAEAFSNPSTFETPYSEYKGHPRTAGTQAKSLRLAREYAIPLAKMIAKLSYYPAKHLGDSGLQSMTERGRLQVGMIADITIFDPENVTENSEYSFGRQGLPPTGIPYVLVNGQVVVRDSVVDAVYPGQPIRFPSEMEGRYQAVDSNTWFKQFGRGN